MAKIEYLADCPDALFILAQWLYDEWGSSSPDSTVQSRIDNLSQRLKRDRLPLALVALERDQTLGTASLILREVDTRPEYEHWLGTVYVHEPYRGQGIGTLLVETAAEKASRLGIDALYLYTRHTETEAWYSKLGWVSLEKLTYQGHPATIMKKLLN